MGDLALGIDCSSTASKVVAWDRNELAGVGDLFVTSTAAATSGLAACSAAACSSPTPEHE